MAERIHKAKQFRASIAGVMPVMFASNHRFPRHSHDQFGVGVLTSGGQRSWSGVGTVHASAGDLIMVNPGEIHDGAPLDEGGREWRIIYLDQTVVSRELADEFHGPSEVVRPVASDPPLASCIMDLFRCLTAESPDTLESEERLLASVVRLFRAHGLAKFDLGGCSAPVARARERLESLPETQVTLTELAALSGVSRFQLLRGFKREVGVTPHAYLLQRRVLLARRQIDCGQTLAEAALQAGFTDQSHMNRAFMRQFGVTPGRYRMAVS